jgi:mannosyltransferase
VSGAALCALVAGAAAVRLFHLGLPALSSDEAFSWRLAGYPLGEMVRRTAQDVHSPLSYLLLKAWLFVAGDSAAALRGLAVLCGTAAVVLTYALVREAARPHGAGGALLAAALVALHPLQVQQGRNARMYALGVALAALTSWLLLRALRRGGRRAWVAYGLAAGLFVYTHYYALFTLAAQGLAALVLWPRGRRDDGAPPAPILRPLLGAAGVALLLLLPWLPAFLGQARRVQGEYWIPPVTAAALLDTLTHWATGVGGLSAGLIALFTVLLMIGWGMARAPRPVLFFLAQAALPWILAGLVAVVGQRPLLLERFTVFAQIGLFALVGVAWSHLPRAAAAVAALVLAGVALLGLASFLRDLPDEPPAAAAVARYVRRGRQPDDVVVVDSPRALNKMLFYLKQEGAADLPVRCLPGLAGGGHYTHTVSLSPGEQVARVEDGGGARLWRCADRPYPTPPAPPGWSIGYARVFEGGLGEKLLLARYDRIDP